MADYTARCATCHAPIAFCGCAYPTAEQWAYVQLFRRECVPEAFNSPERVAVITAEGLKVYKGAA